MMRFHTPEWLFRDAAVSPQFGPRRQWERHRLVWGLRRMMYWPNLRQMLAWYPRVTKRTPR